MKKYDSYKDSGIEWLGEIPKHWEESKLKYLFFFGKGLTITKENLEDVGVPCVNYGEIHSHCGFKVNPEKNSLKCVSEDYLKSFNNSLLTNGDFVFADTSEDIEGSGNFTHLYGDKNVFAGYHTIILKPSQKLNSRFFAYHFDSLEFRSQIRSTVKGIKVLSVTQSILKNCEVWIPSFEEQTAIAYFLDHKTAQIDDLIAKKERLIQLLEEERTAIINQVVTKGLDPNVPMKDSGIEWLGEIPEHWDRARIKTLVKTKVCDGPHETPEWKEDGVPFISAEAIKGNQIDLNYKRGFISQEQHLEYCKKSKVLKGDILFCKSGSTTGKSALVEIDDEFGIWSPLAIIRVDERKITNRFMFQSIQSSLFRNQVETSWTFGTQPNIGMGALENLWIAIPPLNEQELIDEFLSSELIKFESIISKTVQEIELLKEYKTALISEVVTGKVDVRN